MISLPRRSAATRAFENNSSSSSNDQTARKPDRALGVGQGRDLRSAGPSRGDALLPPEGAAQRAARGGRARRPAAPLPPGPPSDARRTRLPDRELLPGPRQAPRAARGGNHAIPARLERPRPRPGRRLLLAAL